MLTNSLGERKTLAEIIETFPDGRPPGYALDNDQLATYAFAYATKLEPPRVRSKHGGYLEFLGFDFDAKAI